MAESPRLATHALHPPNPPTFGGRVAARAAWLVASAIAATTRWTFQERSGLVLETGSQQVIFALWHNRQLMAPAMYRRFFRHLGSERRVASIASASRDGAIAMRVLELYGMTVVRGSSSRRGARALAELIELAGRGFDIAVTPDGPRGPRYEVKPGVIALAQHTRLPLVPVSLYFSRKKVLRSWDGFQVPLPFGRCEVESGQALPVPADLDDAGRVQWAKDLEQRLRAITRD